MKNRTGLFVVGLLLRLPALLVAQDGGASQSVGVQYSSMTGFLPYYRLELAGPLVKKEGLMLEGKLTNDFSVLGDMLNTSLTASYKISPLLSLSFEIPVSVLYRYPADLEASIAGSARLSLSNRPDPRDQSPGWVFSSELSSTAISSWTSASSPAAFAALTGSRPDEVLPYQAAGLIQVGYSGAVLSPEFKIVATTDLGSLAFADVKSTAALNFGLGVRERTLVVSAETSLFASPGDTKFQGQLNWDHLVGGVSLGVAEALSAPRFDYGFSLGWRF